MRPFTHWILGLFTSPAGVIVLAALDSTLFFSLPFGIDAAVIILAARMTRMAWLVPLLATAGSLAGAALSFWMGTEAGEHGVERYVSPRRLARVRRRVRSSGAVALAVLDLIPPPFPFTAFVLVAGALEVRPKLFFITLAACRVFRFGIEAILAQMWGPRILTWIDSDLVSNLVGWIAVLAIVLTVVSLTRLAGWKPRLRA
jgi:membrane protein YqaA with SNARE-associated domain